MVVAGEVRDGSGALSTPPASEAFLLNQLATRRLGEDWAWHQRLGAQWERQLHAAPGMRVLELTTSSTPRGEEATLSCRCPRHGSAAGGPWCEMAASLRGNSEEREEGTAGVARRRR
jgi:hypothetical protein